MRVKILRQASPATEPYWQEFRYEYNGNQTVAGMLDELNYKDDLVDINGDPAPRIGWECSCLQGVCGSCAMVINGIPALACDTFLKDLKGKEVTIRPLSKFPVVHDLVVDRSSIHENLKQDNAYIGEYRASEDRDLDHQYIAARCLKCGLCLEVCPNYTTGKNFFGAAFANDCYLISSRNSGKAKEIRKVYAEHFGKSCSKALSCMKVCPVGIPTIASMAKLNRK